MRLVSRGVYSKQCRCLEMSRALRRAWISYWNVCLGAGGVYWLRFRRETPWAESGIQTLTGAESCLTLWKHSTSLHIWDSSRWLKNWNETLIKATWLIYRSGVRMAIGGRFLLFWCRIHLWFRMMGGLQAKSMTSQRTPSRHKMADMCYYGNVMTTTRWWLCVTMETFLHLQQYSHRLNLFLF